MLNTHHKPRSLLLMAVAVTLVATIPLVFVLNNSLTLSMERWQLLWSSRLPALMWNTLSLSGMVAIGSLLLGVSTAWLIARREFPGRRLAVWLLVLPLAIPTYVFAHIYTELLQPSGWLGQAWIAVFGSAIPIPDIFTLGGATLVLTLAGFSYVFLLVRASLMRSNRVLEEAARLQGATPAEVFRRVNLPMLRPAIAAGLAVVVLHVLSDFGAVSMLRVQTFTLSIYLQMSGRFDFQSAAGLSLVLVSLSLTFLVVERYFRRRQRYYSVSGQNTQVLLQPAGRLQCIYIWSWLGLVLMFALVLPLAWMLTWTWEAVQQGLIGQDFWKYAGNSLSLAALAATLALLVALPVALYHTRRHSLLSHGLVQLSSVGFVLPGPVIALGFLTFAITFMEPLYGGLTLLVMALAFRFLPLSIQSQEASLQQLTPAIEEAGRLLGAGPLENFRRVIMPMISGGMATAWVLVFIETLKELPATLLLRPTGFDTLPVRIWIEASEEMLELAAPMALLLLAGTLPAVWILVRGELHLHRKSPKNKATGDPVMPVPA